MQLAKERTDANVIRAREAGRLLVGERWVSGSVIVSASDVVTGWAVDDPAALALADLEPALALEPDIVLLGTGDAVVLPDVDLIAELAARGVGLEIMSSAAACRTFNVLVHEHREVVVALIEPG
jgi:uncharacterized protein